MVDVVFNVSNKGVFNWINIILIYWSVFLCIVWELRVDWNIDYFNIMFFEFVEMFVKGDKFWWVNKCKI